MLRAFVALTALTGLLLAPTRVSAQPTQKLFSQSATGTITSSGGTVEMQNAGGLGSLKVQTTPTAYSGTWEVQCSSAPTGITPVYDTDDEVNLSLEGSTAAPVQAVTDAQSIWTASIAGCTAVRVITTAWTSGTLTVYLYATTTGGGSSSGGSGGSSFDGVLLDAAAGDAITDTVNNALRVNVVTGGGSGGTSVNEDVASADAHPGTPAYTVRNNTLTGATGSDGDYQPAKSTAAGATYTAPTYGDVVAVAGNGASGTGVQRVTIANDSTGILATVTNVATIGTSVTPGVAATHLGKAEDAAHTTADTGVMALGVRTDTAAAIATTTGDYTPFILDALNKLWTTGSYAEDAAHADGETGVLALVVRRDADTSLVGTDGDRAPLQVNAAGSLKVAITAGAGSGGTALADNAAFTPATTSFTPIGGEVDDTGTTAASENSAGAARMTVQRAIHVNLRSAAGAELTPTVDVTEDAAETAGGTGPFVQSVRRDVAASSAGTTGDNSSFNTDALGQLWTRQLDPCSGVAKQYLPIDIVTATTTEITASLAGASTHYYICSVALVTAGANNVAIVDDDSDNCGSVTSGVMGGFGSAAEGFNLAANGGLTLGNGQGSIARTNGTNRVLCIITSAAVQLSGTITVVAAP